MSSNRITVTAEDLSSEVIGILNRYSDDVASGLSDAVMMTAKETLKILKEKSPKRTKEYAKSWKITKQRRSSGYYGRVTAVTIHNKDRYRLAHLLEYGHAKAGGGRVEGIPHIKTAEQEAIRRLPEMVIRELEGID